MDCLLAASECLISCCLSCLLRLRALHRKRVWLQCKVTKGSYGHPHFKQAQRSRLPPCAACRAVGPPKRHVTVRFTRHGPVAAFPKSRNARVRIDWRSSRQERPTATLTTHIASDPPLTNFNLFSPSSTIPSSHRGSTTDPETCPGRVSNPPQNGSHAGDVGVCEANSNHAGVCRDPACNTTGRTVPPR